jgi:hypothetical protein
MSAQWVRMVKELDVKSVLNPHLRLSFQGIAHNEFLLSTQMQTFVLRNPQDFEVP